MEFRDEACGILDGMGVIEYDGLMGHVLRRGTLIVEGVCWDQESNTWFKQEMMLVKEVGTIVFRKTENHLEIDHLHQHVEMDVHVLLKERKQQVDFE